MVDHPAPVVVFKCDERAVGQILRLRENREAMEPRSFLELIADLGVENPLADRRSEGRGRRKAGDLSEELGPIAVAQPRLESVPLVITFRGPDPF